MDPSVHLGPLIVSQKSKTIPDQWVDLPIMLSFDN